jgi:hypothetical protein
MVSKKIGLIAEDNSDIEVVDEILLKYMPSSHYSIKKFVGNGCGKLKQKSQSWTDSLFRQGCEHVIIFHDLDRNKENELRQLLNSKVPQRDYPCSLIVIPKEEMEAWLLSDSEALRDVFKMGQLPKTYHDCELVNSPKEEIKSLVWQKSRKRYLNTIHNKQIAAKVSLENFRRCSSFSDFDTYILDKIM